MVKKERQYLSADLAAGAVALCLNQLISLVLKSNKRRFSFSFFFEWDPIQSFFNVNKNVVDSRCNYLAAKATLSTSTLIKTTDWPKAEISS